MAQSPPPGFTFHHGGVSVPDLDEAIAWYGRVLGFEIETRFDIAQANAKAAMLVKGPLRMEVFEVADAAPLPAERRDPRTDLRTHGNKHVAFAIVDLEDFLASVTSKGADVAMVVRESFGRGCFLRDCAGNLVEFVEQPRYSVTPD